MKLSLDRQQACEAEIPSSEALENWLDAALLAAGKTEDAGITIRFVEVDESQSLNLNYRGKNKPTNVLSFPFEQPVAIKDAEINNYLGDVVICSDVVIKESLQQKKVLQAHWAHMCVHGCLHLLGFDHINREQAETMESLETNILASLGFDDPYIQG